MHQKPNSEKIKMKMDIKKYFSQHLPFVIDEIYVNENTEFNESNLEGIVNELFALNQDGERNVAGEVSLALLNLRQKEGELIDSLEQHAGKKMIQESFYSVLSEDYSENVPVTEYLQLFDEPSLKEIIFSPNKKSRALKEIKGENNRTYELSRGELIALNFCGLEKSYKYSDEFIKHFSILFEKGDLPKYKPSKLLKKNLQKVNEDWPYPFHGESSWSSVDDARLGSAMARYLPELDWFKVHLSKGEFGGSFWSSFFLTISKSGFITKGLELHKQYEKLEKLSYVFEAPIEEFSLELTKKDYGNPDVRFTYKHDFNPSLGRIELLIENVKLHKPKEINPYLV